MKVEKDDPPLVRGLKVRVGTLDRNLASAHEESDGLRRRLREIMELHGEVAGDPHGRCAECGVRFPCRTFEVASGISTFKSA